MAKKGSTGGSDIQDLINRMKRIEGQARGIQRMLEEKRPCHEIVQQMVAMRAALTKTAMAVISDHMEECFLADGEDREAAMVRATKLVMRLS